MRQMRCVIYLVLISFMIFTAPRAQAAALRTSDGLPQHTSFLSIPGITEEEISLITALQKKRTHFVYGMTLTTEAFYDESGTIRGFAALFCDWLTELFGIPFVPAIHEWGDLAEGLENHTIDFTGELTATEERRKMNYFMTDTITVRVVKYMQLAGSVPLADLAASRKLNFAFLNGTPTSGLVAGLSSYDFQSHYVDDYETAYEVLKSRVVDAFFYEGSPKRLFVNTATSSPSCFSR